MSSAHPAAFSDRLADGFRDLLGDGGTLLSWYRRRREGKKQGGKIAAYVSNRIYDQLTERIPTDLGALLPSLVFEKVTLKGRPGAKVRVDLPFKLKWDVECVFYVDSVRTGAITVPFTLDLRTAIDGIWMGAGDADERVRVEGITLKAALYVENRHLFFLPRKIKLGEREIQLVEGATELRKEDAGVGIQGADTR